MRAAVIVGLGCSPKYLKPFQVASEAHGIEWRTGMPTASDEADAILLFGGDGTIYRHLGPLVELGLPVLIVPVGSGNDFARALGFRRTRDSLAAWRSFCAGQGNVRAIDLGVLTPLEFAGRAPHDLAPRKQVGIPHYFCTIAGLGLASEVARRANLIPRWLRGHGGYALTLVSTVFQFSPQPMKLSALDQANRWLTRSHQPTILAAFANTSTYGDGMKIAPCARLDDGQLDVCIIGALHPAKLVSLFPTVYFGRHLGIRQVDYFQATRVRLETETPLDVYADGEFACRTPVEVSIRVRALKVLTP